MVFESGNSGAAPHGPRPLDQDSVQSRSYDPMKLDKKATLELMW